MGWEKHLYNDSGEGNLSIDGGSLQEVYLCDWSDRYTEAQALLEQPHSDIGWFTCNNVNIERGGIDTATSDTKKAVLTASFSRESANKQTSVDGDTDNWRFSITFSGQALTIPGNGWHWVGDGKALTDDDPINPIKIIPQATIKIDGAYTTFDKTKINDTIGKMNSSAFLGYPAKTLLFTGLQVSQTEREIDGSDLYELSYTFLNNPHTWEEFWRTDKNMWDQLLDSNDNPAYEEAAFSNIQPQNW